MSNQKKLPAWVEENLPDDAVWSEYFLIAHKEETRSGNRVNIEQTVRPPKEAAITGKEIKTYFLDQASSSTGLILIAVGLGILLLALLLKEPMHSSNGFLVLEGLIALCAAGGGVYMLVQGQKLSKALSAVTSWDELEPFVETALTEKVYADEIAARKKEHGETGAAYAGYYCIPASLASQGAFDKAKSNFGLQEALKSAMLDALEQIPAEGRKLARKQ